MLLRARKGSIIHIDLYDSWGGTAEVIEDGVFKCTVRPLEVCPCYSCQQTPDSEPTVVRRKEIYSVENRKLFHWWFFTNKLRQLKHPIKALKEARFRREFKKADLPF